MKQPTSIKRRQVPVKKPVPVNKPFYEQPPAPPAPVPKPMIKKPKSTPTMKKMFAKGGWIQNAIKKPGALREQLGIKKGEKIPKAKLAAAAKKGGKLGQRARLAITLGKMNKK